MLKQNLRPKLFACAIALVSSEAQAQTMARASEPAVVQRSEAPPVAHGVDYVVPDLPPSKPRKMDGFFSIRPSIVLLGDYTAFSQDSVNIAQVGEQRDRWEVRAARIQLLGHVGSHFKVRYQIAGEYKGFDGDPNTKWQLTDLSVTLPLGTRTSLQLGKAKEAFAYEMVGDAANLPGSERVLSPFFVSRNTGARLVHNWGATKQGTVTLAVNNDKWDIGTVASRGIDVSGRLTALVWEQPDEARFLHVGAAFRHVASKGNLRYRGKPGSNVATNFVDTGELDADDALHLGVEGLLNLGSVSFLGEWVTAKVDSPSLDNPRFSGWYVTGSWVLTGETRPYDRSVGYSRRVIPKGRWGAPELVARWAETDLRDTLVDGGRFRRLDLGVNWWATTRWKFGMAYGHIWLDRDGTRGSTDTMLTRFQWVY